MTARHTLTAAGLLGTFWAANTQLLVLKPAHATWALVLHAFVLMPSTNRVIIGHRPVIMVFSNAPPQATRPDGGHRLVRAGLCPSPRFLSFSPPSFGVATPVVAMSPGMPAAL